MTDYLTLVNSVQPSLDAGDWNACLRLFDQFWASVPEPKESVGNSHLIPRVVANLSVKRNDLERAWYWANEFSIYRKTFMAGGECDFLLGRVAFLRNDLESASRYFKAARKISGLRLFRGENSEYRVLSEST